MIRKADKSYLFIIPLFPVTHNTENRLALRVVCMTSLLMQSYPNWKALIIGNYREGIPDCNNFIFADFEGPKEDKIEFAVNYILENKLTPDYLIRLDDDDVFNPNILQLISKKEFDLYVDFYHHFWKVDDGLVSQSLKFWFPNTCILKMEDALKDYGFKHTTSTHNQSARLIENEHNNFHLYYNKKHKVLFASKEHPIYIRSINPDSISFTNAVDTNKHILQFGIWKKNRLKDFLFLKEFNLPTPYNQLKHSTSFLKSIKLNIREKIDRTKYIRMLGINRSESLILRGMITSEVYKQCSRCVLDTTVSNEITFDEYGVCNYCHTFENDYFQFLKMKPEIKEAKLHKIVDEIKADGKEKKYDVVCGVSGGVDSSYLAIRAKELGLRALLVHFDNGWNSELAVKNVERICNYTGFDLHTYVVNWDEFKDLQLAYIKAGVLDWEVPTDHGLWAVILKRAKVLNVKYILIGANYQTEGILPKSMRYDKADLKNIKDIYKKFGTRKSLRSFPTYPFWWNQYLKWVWSLKLAPLLYYMDYDKAESKQYLIDTIGWRDYGGKHYESIFTRFYQGYVLVEKFGFDKRKAHLASLINSGQITKKEALEELSKPIMDKLTLEEDMSFFQKKMGLSESEFQKIMKEKPVPHEMFASYSTFEYPLMKKILIFLVRVKKLLKRNG